MCVGVFVLACIVGVAEGCEGLVVASEDRQLEPGNPGFTSQLFTFVLFPSLYQLLVIVLQFNCLPVVDIFVGQCNPDWNVLVPRPVLHSGPWASSHAHYSTKTGEQRRELQVESKTHQRGSQNQVVMACVVCIWQQPYTNTYTHMHY